MFDSCDIRGINSNQRHFEQYICLHLNFPFTFIEPEMKNDRRSIFNETVQSVCENEVSMYSDLLTVSFFNFLFIFF